jgi:hypothetical protein
MILLFYPPPHFTCSPLVAELQFSIVPFIGVRLNLSGYIRRPLYEIGATERDATDGVTLSTAQFS